jgi:phage repressor protein C with HTH and peptisase S24 domain
MAVRNFEDFAKRLNLAAKRKGIKTPAEIANITGMNRITLGSYMRGERAASLEACITLAKALGCSPSWLHSGKEGGEVDRIFRGAQRESINHSTPNVRKNTGNGDPDPSGNASDRVSVALYSPRQIPLFSSALAGSDGAVTIGEAMEMTDAPAILSSVKDAYAVRVSGESMEPRYYSGETAYVHPTMPVKRGDFVVAQIAENGNEGAIQGFVKRFISIDDKQLVLEQLNPRKEIKFTRNRVRFVHKIVLGG